MSNRFFSRRDVLKAGFGMGLVGAGAVEAGERPLAARSPHFTPRAKAVIHLFMNGGPSHIDTFDPKPLLKKYHGKKLPVHLKTERETAGAMASPFEFKKYGESGLEISEIFSEVGAHADDLCVIRSMTTNTPNHESSFMMMNCGDNVLSRPSYGAWLSYGLGSENENLPGFIAMCPNGTPTGGAANWRSAFLPGIHQATHIDTQYSSVERLIANIRNPQLSQKAQRHQLDLLRRLESERQDPLFKSRLQSYELAYRMQMEATDAFDISQEPRYIREMYGNTVQARQMLIARRLVERGVRCIQLYHGQGQPWDSHDDLEKSHRRLGAQCSQGIAALLTDLKQRGLLDETLIVWGGEFGRTPTVELPKAGSNEGKINGRDHNNHGFTVWLAGGGVKGGQVIGATDELGLYAIDDRMHVRDIHASILALLGLDNMTLTYDHRGRPERPTINEGAFNPRLVI